MVVGEEEEGEEEGMREVGGLGQKMGKVGEHRREMEKVGKKGMRKREKEKSTGIGGEGGDGGEGRRRWRNKIKRREIINYFY